MTGSLPKQLFVLLQLDKGFYFKFLSGADFIEASYIIMF